MHPIFKVSKSEIQQLNDEQARELIARLCQAEIRHKGLSTSAVIWGGDQRAKDGGVDVRVVIEDALSITGYIPKINTIFQVKAVKKFTAASIKMEMAPKSLLLPSITEQATCSGAYIIASTKGDHSASVLEGQKITMKSCIDAASLADKIHVDFYDSVKIADWTEQHPAIVIWVKSTLGNSIVGWKPYAPWAYREKDLDAEYIIDDKVRIIAPDFNEPITVVEAIEQLRRSLIIKKTSVRIAGLSGVGKTRLVQALFDERIVTETKALERNNVIYTDISDNPSPQPNTLIDALLIDAADTIVIVDNCGADTHDKLTELVKRQGSNISLVTLEYDIRDDQPEGTRCYRLDASSNELIKQLLARRYPEISQNDIEKITEFSSGNARVAFALAGTSETKGQLGKLENHALFKRLFWQSNQHDDNLLKSAEVCSLLYSFDTADISDTSELLVLASIAEVSVAVLIRQVNELQRRGLVQQRGKWKSVLPHAIANRLAAQALENSPRSLLIPRLLNKSRPRIAKSFAHRLGFLHLSEAAREIVAEWLAPGGFCADLVNLDQVGLEIFTFIAPVNQSATLSSLLLASQYDEFISLKAHNRQNFIRTAYSLAYEEQHFDQAVSVLLRFASVEPESNNHDMAHKKLESFFSCYLSGTLAPPLQRANIIKQLFECNDPVKIRLGINLLMKTLDTGSFYSHCDVNFGAHSRSFGWQPQTNEDLLEWYGIFIAIALEIGVKKNYFGSLVRREFANQFRGLWAWVQVDLSAQLKQVAEIFHSVDGWTEGNCAIRMILRFDVDKLSEGSLSKLTNLEDLLAPKNLCEQIRLKVVIEENYFDDLDDDTGTEECRYEQYYVKLEQLGKLAGNDAGIIVDFLPLFLKGNSHNTYPFSLGVAQTYENITNLLSCAKEIIVKIEASKLDLTFIRGLISGWNKTNPDAVSDFLDSAIDDVVWGQFFPFLQTAVPLSEHGYLRLIRSIEIGQVPTWRFKCLQNGRVTASLTPDQIMTLISSMAKTLEGTYVAIEILNMVIYGVKDKDEMYRTELANRCIYFLRELDWQVVVTNDRNFEHHFGTFLEFTLQAPIASQNFDSVFQRLLDFERENSKRHFLHLEIYFRPFLNCHTKKSLDLIYRPDSDGSYRSALTLLNSRYTFSGRKLFCPPEDLVLEWCQVSPSDRLVFIAQICPIFKLDKNEIDCDSINGLSKLAKSIYDLSENKELIINYFLKQFVPTSWSGSRAAIIRSRIPVLDEFDTNHDPNLKQIILIAKANLEEIACADAADREERDRAYNERFE